ncbi:MAG: sigma-70 family RNA polymerase sigma factor [Deltaproteobacteria bacterium]|nr:sigma-70 family RNA polymerase sigma factor [Deltaproteobacteria bacterium]
MIKSVYSKGEKVGVASRGAVVIAEITELLDRCREGDRAASDAVFAQLYPELRRIAAGKLFGSDATVTPTVLVHEVYLRLTAGTALDVESRRHFYTSAAKAMRHVLIDQARRKAASKRGGDEQRVTFTEGVADRLFDDGSFLDLDRALKELATINGQGRQVVELRYFAGLTAIETAELLGISESTVKRQWKRARAFLVARLREGS